MRHHEQLGFPTCLVHVDGLVYTPWEFKICRNFCFTCFAKTFILSRCCNRTLLSSYSCCVIAKDWIRASFHKFRWLLFV